jgi:hypothetical protein
MRPEVARVALDREWPLQESDSKGDFPSTQMPDQAEWDVTLNGNKVVKKKTVAAPEDQSTQATVDLLKERARKKVEEAWSEKAREAAALARKKHGYDSVDDDGFPVHVSSKIANVPVPPVDVKKVMDPHQLKFFTMHNNGNKHQALIAAEHSDEAVQIANTKLGKGDWAANEADLATQLPEHKGVYSHPDDKFAPEPQDVEHLSVPFRGPSKKSGGSKLGAPTVYHPWGPAQEAALAESKQTAALSVTHAPIGKGGTNWVTKTKPGNTGQLPAYIQNIRNAMMRDGKSESEATGMAVGAVKRWASGRGGVSDEVKAAAAKAVAEWEKLKGESHAEGAAKKAA